MSKTNKYFKNKVVWMTCGASVHGEALAIQLSAAGARLVLSGGKYDTLERIRSFCDSEVVILPYELADFDQMDEIVERAVYAFGNIDIVVNNIGLDYSSNVLKTDLIGDESLTDANHLIHIALSNAILPHLRQTEEGQLISMHSCSSYSANSCQLEEYYNHLQSNCDDMGIKLTIPAKSALAFDNSLPSAENRIKAAKASWNIMIHAASAEREVSAANNVLERFADDVRKFIPAVFTNVIKLASI